MTNNDFLEDGVSAGSRLGVTFHRTLQMSRESLQMVLELAMNAEELGLDDTGIQRKFIRDLTPLGTIYVQAVPRYGVGTGLLAKNNRPTIIGKTVFIKDPLFSQPSTQWLMHYHLSAPQGPGPLFWHELAKTRFRVGQEFTGSEIAAQIAEIYQRESGTPLAEKSARSTATIFLGTYTKPDGLASLNLLIPTGDDRYQLNDDIDPPPAWVVAYAILDHWQAYYPSQKTINMDDLAGENGVGNIFMVGAGKVANILQKMQLEGLVDVFRAAPPYQVVLLKPDLDFILQKIYATE